MFLKKITLTITNYIAVYKNYVSLVICLLSAVALMAFVGSTPGAKQDAFQLGESFEYKVKLGFIPIGLATVEVGNTLATQNNKPTYRVRVVGRTTGISDVFRVRNVYQSYIDTLSLLPQRFVYSAKEGDFRREQSIFFSHQQGRATRTENGEKKSFTIPRNCHDVVSIYYHLRTLPLDKMTVGQVVETPLFFSDELYHLKARIKGRKSIKTSFGRINAFQVVPLIPSNSLFGGEEAISIWISDDKNRVPVQIDVAFKVGHATFELKKYKGQKHPFEWRN